MRLGINLIYYEACLININFFKFKLKLYEVFKKFYNLMRPLDEDSVQSEAQEN